MERKVNYGYVERTHGLKGRMILKLFVMGPAVARGGNRALPWREALYGHPVTEEG